MSAPTRSWETRFSAGGLTLVGHGTTRVYAGNVVAAQLKKWCRQGSIVDYWARGITTRGDPARMRPEDRQAVMEFLRGRLPQAERAFHASGGTCKFICLVLGSFASKQPHALFLRAM